jgi:uncharacterized protein (DUF736 family)
MPTIGQFKKTKKGYEGRISTLTMDCEVSLAPNENKKHEDSPDFFVKSGECDLGFARHTIAQGDDGQPYIAVFLDDPSFRSPIWAALFETDGDANLVWSRSRKRAN